MGAGGDDGVRVALSVMLLAVGAGCATKSDCVRADDALVAASERLVGETPSVTDGDAPAEAADKLLDMAEVLDDERARIAAMHFTDATVSEAMSDYAEGLRRVVQIVRQTARATTKLVESVASLDVANASLTRSLGAFESACEGATPPCAISAEPLPKGTSKEVLMAVEQRIRAVETSDPGALRARTHVLRQLGRVQELLVEVAEATEVVARVGRELDDLEALSKDVRSRLDQQCSR